LEYDQLIALGKSRGPSKGYHKHRVVPGYEGGKYTADNLAYLTRAEHIAVHRLRWERLNNWRDLLACKLLGDKLSDDEWDTCARNGGILTGQFHAINKTGVCGRSQEKMSADGKKGGAAVSKDTHIRGGKTMGNRLKATGKGIFGIPPEQDKLNRAKGGRIQFLKLSYYDRVKGVLGTKWITNGNRNIRLKSGESIPQGFRLGKADYHSHP
jgi:hypothetical protein